MSSKYVTEMKITKKLRREVFKEAYKLFETEMEDVCTEVTNSIIDDLFGELYDHPDHRDRDFNDFAELACDIYQEVFDKFRGKKK